MEAALKTQKEQLMAATDSRLRNPKRENLLLSACKVLVYFICNLLLIQVETFLVRNQADDWLVVAYHQRVLRWQILLLPCHFRFQLHNQQLIGKLLLLFVKLQRYLGRQNTM
jgi:hypothetical protein